MNRQQRRAAGKKLQHVPGGLDRAGQQVQAALDAIQKIQGLEGAVKTLEGLQGEIREANALLKAMVGDMETLNKELGLQREISLRLVAHFVGRTTSTEDEVREFESRLRAETQPTDESD
jgi:hypothetical protein